MIDFEIIWKSIHNLASEEEIHMLEDWLNSDPGNLKYYNSQKELLTNPKSLHTHGPEIEKSWKAINDQISGKKKIRTWWVASVAAVFLISFLFYFYHNNSRNTIVQSEQLSDIKPGRNKAILILDDGTEYSLSDSTSLSLNEGGTAIKKEGTQIRYLSEFSKDHFPENIKYNTLKVPRGGEFYIVLSDSTKIWLNSETYLKYPVEFLSDERIVSLEGEAYFEVAHSGKPFKVFTGEQVVEVMGTSFNISSYKEDSLTYTTLIEGKVKVFLKDKPEINQTLLPNFQSYLYKSEQMISVREVDPFPFIAWKQGRFYFKQEPLSEIVHTLSRWYDIDIKIENEKIRNIKFTGNIKRYDNLENILALIKETNEISYEYTKDHEVLLK